ncbi:MAG: hypothetical protein SAK29_23060 [Scytonema sp. PMC 1069.18]|nr:hypothetical protein [Scytonema sp. PMC 1069.18]MEC4884501.1 hypothetical protein [Scytonema sp. PMC 1070.18]
MCSKILENKVRLFALKLNWVGETSTPQELRSQLVRANNRSPLHPTPHTLHPVFLKSA